MKYKEFKISRSKKLAQETIYTAFNILKNNDNEMQGRKLMEKISEEASLDEWAKHIYEKTGYIR